MDQQGRSPPQPEDTMPSHQGVMPAHSEGGYRARGQWAGRTAMIARGDSGIGHTAEAVAAIGIVVNHVGEQHPVEDVSQITAAQRERTFGTTLFGYLCLTHAAPLSLKPGSAITDATSVAAYKGKPPVIDDAANEGAVATASAKDVTHVRRCPIKHPGQPVAGAPCMPSSPLTACPI